MSESLTPAMRDLLVRLCGGEVYFSELNTFEKRSAVALVERGYVYAHTRKGWGLQKCGLTDKGRDYVDGVGR